jgi:hypothetical protein
VGGGERREVAVGTRRVLALIGPSRSGLAMASGADLWLLIVEGTTLEPWLPALSVGLDEETR